MPLSELTAVSLFAGIEGIGLALERCGVRVKASAEIDAECRGVIARHFPQVKLFNDVRTVTGDDLRAAGFVPGRGILTAGFPCQDLSVAGRRTGLAGARSGLFWEIVRLAGELSPRWLLLENVPGLLSAVCSCPGDETCVDNGRAVRCGRWEKRDGKRAWLAHVAHAPEGGACSGGCMGLHGGAMGTVLGALGKLGYGFAWRVLDAQFFGVPQRRERVFIVGCLGDRAAPVEVLLEPEGGTGHSAARGEKRAHAPGGAGSRAGGASVAATLQAGANGRGHRIDAESAAGGHLIPLDLAQITSDENRSNPQPGDPMGTLAATGRPAVAYALTARDAKGPDSDATSGFIMVPEVASESGPLANADHSHRVPRLSPPLTAEGHDASEDGTGRQALIPVAATLTGGSHSAGVNEPGRRSEDDVNLVFEGTREIAQPVTASSGRQPDNSDTNLGPTLAMAFNPWTGGSKDFLGYRDKPGALNTGQVTGVQTAAAVRRLTPLERERLQGFPDNWTRWRLDEDGREVEQSDSARDRQTGNAVAVPCVEWIARRLVAVDARAEAAA